MQLERSTFAVYKLIISNLPVLCIRVLIVLLSLLILVNFVLMAWHPPQFRIHQCLKEYYNLTHPSLQSFINAQVSDKGIALLNNQIEQQPFLFVNTTTLLRFGTNSNVTDKCIIQTNYLRDQKSLNADSNLQTQFNYEELGVMYLTPKMYFIGRNNSKLISKHGMHIHRVIVPPIKTGYRFVGMDWFVSRSEDFVYGLRQSLKMVQIQIKLQWINQISDLNTTARNASNQKSTAEQSQSGTKPSPAPSPSDSSIQSLIRNKFLNKLQKSLASMDISAGQTLRYWLSRSDTKRQELSLANNGHHQIVQVILGMIWMFQLFSVALLSTVLTGLFVRYSFICLATVFSFFSRRVRQNNISWLHRYVSTAERGSSNSFTLFLQIIFAFMAINVLYVIVFYYQISIIFQYLILGRVYYSRYFLYTFFLIEVFHYLFARTRTTLRFFCDFSTINIFACLFYIYSYPGYNSSGVLMTNLLITLLLMAIFLAIEKQVSLNEFDDEFKPSFKKPRMLFYAGYDMEWHKGIPPIWTSLIPHYDLSYFNQKQKAYLQQNYELLYGKLMGMDEQQEIPEDSDEEGSILMMQISESSN